MRRLTFLLSFLVVPLLSGCAWVHQNAILTVNPQIAASSIGNGANVTVRVLDRRQNKIIGYRGLDSKNASITTEQDLAALLQGKILEGLARKGFRAVPYTGQPAAVLTVELRELTYTTDMEFWKGIVQTACSLRAFTVKGGAAFERSYLGAHKENAIEAPGAKTNERLISAAMTSALQRFFEDDQLAALLAN